MKEESSIIKKIYEVTANKGGPGLARMRRILELLGHPEKDLRVVHVAGTNGKGSVVRFIASILRENGYSAGVYTSPHVTEYNERFETDGVCISDEDFERYANEVISLASILCTEGYGNPSPFEIFTCIAFQYFRDSNSDFVILETGLGGRLDMTNVVEKPLVTVITQIDFDHTQELGDTLEKIAHEKAGIIKPGVPVVLGTTGEEARNVIMEVAAEKNAELTDILSYTYYVKQTCHKIVFDLCTGESLYENIEPGIYGEHQMRNVAAAVAACEFLEKNGLVSLTKEKIKDGLRKTKNPGRFEVLCDNPYVIIDGAHNPSGIRAAVQALKSYFGNELCYKKLLVVIGCFKDKDFEGMIDELVSQLKGIPFDLMTTEPVSSRRLSASEFLELFESRGYKGKAIADEEEAYDLASCGEYDIVLFLGSIYLIGDIRKYFNEKGWNQR